MSQIDKVKIIHRRLIKDNRGWFLKTLTGLEDSIPSHTGEVYVTMAKPGQAKGGHYHPLAVEWFTIIAGEGNLKLEDVVTHERMEISMSLEKAITVFIPNGVAHIVENNTDKLYDPADTIPFNID